MDQRKRKRIALAAGLFFLAFLAGIVLTVKAARQNYESTARQMAALAEEIPESEAVFAGILGGKDPSGKSDQTKKGKELLAKYGYHFADSLRLGALPGYAGGMALILAAGLLGCSKAKEYAEACRLGEWTGYLLEVGASGTETRRIERETARLMEVCCG